MLSYIGNLGTAEILIILLIVMFPLILGVALLVSLIRYLNEKREKL